MERAIYLKKKIMVTNITLNILSSFKAWFCNGIYLNINHVKSPNLISNQRLGKMPVATGLTILISKCSNVKIELCGKCGLH